MDQGRSVFLFFVLYISLLLDGHSVYALTNSDLYVLGSSDSMMLPSVDDTTSTVTISLSPSFPFLGRSASSAFVSAMHSCV